MLDILCSTNGTSILPTKLSFYQWHIRMGTYFELLQFSILSTGLSISTACEEKNLYAVNEQSSATEYTGFI